MVVVNPKQYKLAGFHDIMTHPCPEFQPGQTAAWYTPSNSCRTFQFIVYQTTVINHDVHQRKASLCLNVLFAPKFTKHLLQPAQCTADDLCHLCRVKQPPWADEAAAAAPASLQQLIQPDATAAPAPWQTHTQQGDLPSTSTEVGQFEPLPDSPTGNRTAAGRVFDQQHDSQELQQQQQRAVAQQEVKKADSWVAPAVQPQLRVRRILTMLLNHPCSCFFGALLQWQTYVMHMAGTQRCTQPYTQPDSA